MYNTTENCKTKYKKVFTSTIWGVLKNISFKVEGQKI